VALSPPAADHESVARLLSKYRTRARGASTHRPPVHCSSVLAVRTLFSATKTCSRCAARSRSRCLAHTSHHLRVLSCLAAAASGELLLGCRPPASARV